jgi:pimeloyl-ACP methyl ester carboxylesterase
MHMESVERSGPAIARANGIEICYETFGDPSDPALLLIMGLSAQMIVWDEAFCTLLAQRGRYVIRFDNRDVGKSTRFESFVPPAMGDIFMATVTGKALPTAYTLVDMVRDAAGLLDALGIERADVVGASMGGAIVQEFAINLPERLRSVTSIMSSTGAPGLPPPTPQALGVLTRQTSLEREPFVESYIEAWHILACDHFPFDRARMQRQAETTYERGINPAGTARQMLAIVASGNRKPALGAVRVPTLVIHGSLDPLIPLAHGRDVAASIPGATLEIVEGMGHTLPRDAWPQIVDAIDAHASAAAVAR